MLVDDKHPASGASRSFLESNCSDQSTIFVTEESIGKLLLGLEGGVRFRRIVGKTIDGEARGSERFIRVPKETCLSGTYAIT